MRNILSSILFLCLSACSMHRPVADANRTRVFPLGTYTHQVRLEFKNHETLSFQGVVKLSQNEIRVVGLSPFQTTLFRITDDLRHRPKVEVVHEKLKGKEPFFVDFYKLLRATLLYDLKSVKGRSQFKVQELDSENYPLRLVTAWRGKKMQIEFIDYDSSHIPRSIRMEHPDFNVTAEIANYEF